MSTTQEEQQKALAHQMRVAGVAFLDLVHLQEHITQQPCRTAKLLVNDDDKRMFDLVGTARRPPTRWFTRNVDCRYITLPDDGQTPIALLVVKFFDEKAQPLRDVKIKELDYVTIVPVLSESTEDWVHVQVGTCMATPDGWLIAPLPADATILEVS